MSAIPSDFPPLQSDTEEVRSFSAFDRVTWRTARAFAVGVPAWVLLLWGFAEARLLPGVAFVLASLLATVITIAADRIMVTSARARRLLPFLGIAGVVAWSLVPFILAIGDTAAR